MAVPSRTTQINKLHKTLKKHYKPVPLDPERSVLDHLLFACCAENAHYDAAEEAFAALVHNFFDLNEIRVSSVRELGEVMSRLPDPAAAAHRVKRALQGVFEATYDFDLENLHKLNLGPATEQLEKYGTTKYSVAYVVQAALGGHAIPTDAGVLKALLTVDLIGEKDVKAGIVPGLARAVAKSKGPEFASLLHQLGADFFANPYAPPLKAILVEINPDAVKRLPKRRTKRQEKEAAERKRKRLAARRAKQDKDIEQPKKPSDTKKKAPKAEKKSAKKAATEAKPAAARKKPTVEKKKSPTKKKTAGAKSSSGSGKKRTGSAGISKRKPR